MTIEIYDCTLREGEQAEGASFTTENRIELCKKLDEFGVDFIELGWPLASKEISESFKKALEIVKKAKIVAFGSTAINENIKEDKNLNSIVLTGVKYACIFGKTDRDHVEKQLKINPEDNLNKISESVKFLKQEGLHVFYDAEHYFDGFKKDSNYALETLVSALSNGAERIILCDTNGGILPDESFGIIRDTIEGLKKRGFKESEINLGVHFHDDSALALANTLSSLPYIKQVQGTINGIGERVGNLNFSEFLPVYIKKLKGELDINLSKLKEISDFAFKISGLSPPEKRAFVGDTAFAHKGGVHIDAIKKGAGYEHANPEDFGNKTVILLNSLGGRSSVVGLAEQFGYNLDKNDFSVKEKIQELFEELKDLEKKGYRMGSLKSEQFLLFERHFGENRNLLKIKEWNINSELRGKGERSYFKVACELDNELFEDSLTVDGGPVDAAFKTLRKIISKKYPDINNLNLSDFQVSIAIRHNEESAVRTEIFFQNKEKFSTVGVDQNILGSSIQALEKGFNYYLLNSKAKPQKP
ncbi:MAG: alpha-isopropylmalate synthase regulatory domain-containing protein [archaeon]